MPPTRYIVLAAATVASLSAGTNYCFSAYAPQLATQLELSSTQLNIVGAAGNLGVYLSSPIIGRIVDRRGPKPTLVFAAVALSAGYLIIRAFYTTAAPSWSGSSHEASTEPPPPPRGWFAAVGLPGLVAAQLLTGMGSTAGLSSVGNSVAKSFRKRRAAALSVVLSGFGLSAFFYSTLASLVIHTPQRTRLHPGEGEDTTPSFLLLLALGSLFSMLVGLVFVRPVPPAPKSEAVEAFAPAERSSDARAGSEGDGYEAEESDLLIDTRTSNERDGILPPQTPAPPRAAAERTPLLRNESTTSVVPDRNVTGWALLREVDFYLIFVFNGLCAGVGLCYINNLGTIVRSLSYPLGTPSSEVARAQAHLVSLLSVFNFLGRLLSGFGSDYFLHRRSGAREGDAGSPIPPPASGSVEGGRDERVAPVGGSSEAHQPESDSRSLACRHRRRRWTGSLPRVTFLPLTGLLFLASQLTLLLTTRPSRLYLPTALTGLAHGCLFGLSGIIGLERFGMRSFSQTNGVLALAPAVFGQAMNLAFGRIYDAHLPSPPPSSSLSSPAFPPPRVQVAGSQCTAGRACYAPATVLTCGMALAATGVGIVLATVRKEMRRRAG